ncbi:transcription antitermination factor NusB [Rickettsia endosymbiont of Polydrusus tereticollis]|uniref:transcription antitermination factor NusB n=1 Tax=Rickettsia endosymbiont of Polydrusus tereticollis TaxID=3066251 RepID=UPI003132F2AA
MSSNKINKKTIARIAAVQAIYQYTLQSSEQNIDSIVEKMLAFYQDEKTSETSETNSHKHLKITLNISHFRMLVKLVIENFEQIEQIISTHLTNTKDITHMPILLLALLRVSICELLFFADIPAKVVINEFTDIANDMLNEHEIGFVNSMLDTIAKESKKIICQTI